MARNFLRKCGELDLIMRDGRCIVFVEVRYRASDSWGDGVASVTRAKQRRLINAARSYLQHNPHLDGLPGRFDVFAVSGPRTAPSCRWIRGAFAST